MLLTTMRAPGWVDGTGLLIGVLTSLGIFSAAQRSQVAQAG